MMSAKKSLALIISIIICVCLHVHASADNITPTAGDIVTFGTKIIPYFENEDYIITVKSILNSKDFVFVNASVRAKRRFSHPMFYKRKKSDRIDFLLPEQLRLVQQDSTHCIISENRYIDLNHGSDSPFLGGNAIILYNRERSITLDKNEVDDFTLIFRENITPSTHYISILQDGDTRYFNFQDIPVSFVSHPEWKLPYANEQEIKKAIDESDHPICGIYENNDGVRFACIKKDSKYILICLDYSKDYKWGFGDIKGYFSETLNPLVFKGYKFGNRFKSKFQSSFILNGNFIEIVSDEEKDNSRRFGETPPQDEAFLRTYPSTDNIISNRSSWSGSGFALLKGYIVTNYHVVDGANNINISGIDGDFSKSYNAKVVGSDKVCDIALLRIEDSSNTEYWRSIPYTVESKMSDVGESVFALGYPLIGTMGDEVKLTTGIISARSGFEGDVTNYQISVPIQPGNSGGPMFDENGNIVGIICAKHQGAENVGYAIKSSYLVNLIESVADLKIMPTNNELKGLSLKNQVKLIRDYTLLIKCSK